MKKIAIKIPTFTGKWLEVHYEYEEKDKLYWFSKAVSPEGEVINKPYNVPHKMDVCIMIPKEIK